MYKKGRLHCSYTVQPCIGYTMYLQQIKNTYAYMRKKQGNKSEESGALTLDSLDTVSGDKFAPHELEFMNTSACNDVS